MAEIGSILKKLDELFTLGDVKKIQSFLEEETKKALERGKTDDYITLLNEDIGFCRDMGWFEKGETYCQCLLNCIEKEPYKDTLAYATSLLNIANFQRAKKDYSASEKYYLQVLPIYEATLQTDDFRFASYYNNQSLLYQETCRYEKAISCLEKALFVATKYPEARIEVATTYTNLAICHLKLQKIALAKECVDNAIMLFSQDEKKDYHYSGALSAKAEICLMEGDYEGAISFYEETLKHLEMYTGKDTPQYKIVQDNLKSIRGGMALCRRYFETYGRKMLEEEFSEYLDEITAGLVGEGSDCYGFDDEISKDHDYGPRFCLWVSSKTYQTIGEKLQKAYDNLPDVFEGYKRVMSQEAEYRQGVMILEDFLEHLLSTNYMPLTDNDWMQLNENGLSALQNGEIWLQGDGRLATIRAKLKEYPESVRRKKILESYHLVKQAGLYNYFRMKNRGEKVAAMQCFHVYTEQLMKLVYYINAKYPPYYKWLHKGMQDLPKLAEIMDIVEALWDYQKEDETVKGIMQIVEQLLEHAMRSDKALLVENIIALEWEAFDKVDNEGGRADCQDDYETFYIMRKSQYLAWNVEMLQSFYKDLAEAKEKGWNLITEKYARMMESTCREEYDNLKENLPYVSEEKKQLTEEIVKIQVGFMEEFAKEYPQIAKNARVIHSSEDTYFRTSYETYLRGELLTYSDETLKLYGQFIVDKVRENKNLAKEIMENTAKLYGYKDITKV